MQHVFCKIVAADYDNMQNTHRECLCIHTLYMITHKLYKTLQYNLHFQWIHRIYLKVGEENCLPIVNQKCVKPKNIRQ